jgi:GNAT superfamily N-acetyltransferase
VSALIRHVTAEDIPGMYRAWQEMRKHNASHDPRIILVPVTEDEFAVAVREVMDRPTSIAFVAEAEGQVAGFITGAIEQNQPDRLPERHVTVGYLFVDPAHRRAGIARSLVDSVKGWAAKQDGVNHLEMVVLAQDRTAAEFWQSVGFAPFIERLWAPLDVSIDPA